MRKQRYYTRVLLAAAALTLAAVSVAHAVSVSPLALYLDPRNRSGVLMLHNPGSLAEEIEISFGFGYPSTGPDGKTRVVITADAPDGEASAVPWLRAFPRMIRLEPGQRQAVRILIDPPADLAEGEYWARVLVSSEGGRPPIEQREGDVTMQVEIKTVVAVALSYRVGAVSTGLTMHEVAATQAMDGLALSLDLERSGNAAFLGRLVGELVAPNGQVVQTRMQDLAVYGRLRVNLGFDRPGVTSLDGYEVRYTIDTQRPDLPAGAPLPVQPMRGTVTLREDG